MAEQHDSAAAPAQPAPAAPPANWAAIHPKVAISVYAGAVVSFALAVIKAKWGLDLSGQEATLTFLVSGAAAYLMPSGN